MSNLEETIRDLMARGELVGFSCNKSAISGEYLASFTMGSMFGQSLSSDPDPIKALMVAFTSAKMKRKAPSPAKANGVIEQPIVEVKEPTEDPADDLM